MSHSGEWNHLYMDTDGFRVWPQVRAAALAVTLAAAPGREQT